MPEPVSAKVSARYQITVPRSAREQLNIHRGDRLRVDVQDGLLILVPQPPDYTARLAGLHKEVWAGLDTAVYLRRERDAWQASESR